MRRLHMVVKPRHPTPAERDERVRIPLDPEEALRGLLKVKPGDCPKCGGATTVTGGHAVRGDHESGHCDECGAKLHRVMGKSWTVAPQ